MSSVSHVFLLLCVILILALLFSGCLGQRNTTPKSAIEAMCGGEKPLPAGQIYVLSAQQESEEYLSSEMISTLFGNGSVPPEMDSVSDAAFFFSYTHPCEFSVFLCKSSDDTENVAKMCYRRMDILKNVRTDEADIAYVQNATVTVYGKWVVLCISSDPTAAIRNFKKAV